MREKGWGRRSPRSRPRRDALGLARLTPERSRRPRITAGGRRTPLAQYPRHLQSRARTSQQTAVSSKGGGARSMKRMLTTKKLQAAAGTIAVGASVAVAAALSAAPALASTQAMRRPPAACSRWSRPGRPDQRLQPVRPDLGRLQRRRDVDDLRAAVPGQPGAAGQEGRHPEHLPVPGDRLQVGQGRQVDHVHDPQGREVVGRHPVHSPRTWRSPTS